MKVEITRGIVWDGQHCDPGQVVDMNRADAASLIARGRAKPYEPKIVENRAVGVQNADLDYAVQTRTFKKKRGRPKKTEADD